jgi:hypothetical protein
MRQGARLTSRASTWPRDHFCRSTMLPQHDAAAAILADDVERVLTDIDADHGDFAVEFLRHGVLLCLRCPLPALLAGGAGARPDHPILRHKLGGGGDRDSAVQQAVCPPIVVLSFRRAQERLTRRSPRPIAAAGEPVFSPVAAFGGYSDRQNTWSFKRTERESIRPQSSCGLLPALGGPQCPRSCGI